MILVMVPLRFELKALLASPTFSKTQFIEENVEGLPVWCCRELGLFLAWAGHGKVQSALQTQHYLPHFKKTNEKVRAVVCAGAGGGLCSEVRIGDVVVGERTVEHDYKEKFDSRSKKPCFEADTAVLNAFFLESSKQKNFKLMQAVVASGDEDIVEGSRAQELYESTSAVVIGWEGAGVARACRFLGQPFVEVRAITDLANERASADFKVNTRLALSNLASVLFVVAQRFQAEDR